MEDKVIQVSVEDILPNRFQPRLAFNEKELNELSNSILKYGVIQPIVLRKIGNKYEIIAGERRYKATVMAGLKTIPAIINNTDDNTSAEIALLENLQRKNLTVIEEAQSFKKLLDRGFTQEEIATKLGVSQSSIANKLRLLSLPKKVQDALLFSRISERHARSLLSLNDVNMQLELLDRIINERMTVRQTEDEISKILNKNDNDIPESINKIINPIKEEKTEKPHFIQYVPDVVNIEEEINPFQAKFQENIRKIEENINNQEESYYDKIINDDFKNNNFDIENYNNIETNKEESSENEDKFNEIVDKKPELIFEENELTEKKPEIIFDEDIKSKENNKVSIINVVNKVRDFVSDFDDKSIITKEEDFPDRYRITIEIEKDVN